MPRSRKPIKFTQIWTLVGPWLRSPWGAKTATIVRDDFWATTSNKQLNLVQRVRSIRKIDGRAAVVAPGNVPFDPG